jgi:hypothetical protein
VPRTEIRASAPGAPLPPGAFVEETIDEDVDETPRESPWRLLAGVAGGLALLVTIFLAVDVFVLRGEEITVVRGVGFEGIEETVENQSAESPRLIIPITEAGRRHTLIISTYPQELALAWILTSPEGWEVARGRDVLRTDGYRTTHFVPNTTGPHVLEIRRDAGQTTASHHRRLAASRQDRVHVTVRVGDRSLLPRILQRRRGLGEQPPFWLSLG